jgi:O-antigen/teichoic acid export membrane protein
LGFYGALLAQTVVIATMLVIMASRGIVRVRKGFDLGVLRQAICLGGPSLVFDIALMLMRTLDRVIIANFLGLEQLGYYALGAMMLGYLMNIPGATREVMEARVFQTRRGSTPDQVFHQFVVQPMTMIGFSMTVLIGPMVLLLPVIIPWLLPTYAPGVPATQTLMLGGYFLALAFPLRGVLALYGWQKWGAAILLGSVVLHTVLSILLIRTGFGIIGVALSAGFAFSVATACLFFFIVSKLTEFPHGLAGNVVWISLPFAAMLGVLQAVAMAGEGVGWPPLPTVGLQLSLYALALTVGALTAARIGLIPAPWALFRKAIRSVTRSSGLKAPTTGRIDT